MQSPDSTILGELKSHPSLAAIASVETATVLARRFATIEIARGAKLEWLINAIGECAADSAGLGLKPEALQKKLRAYCDNARAPRTPQEKTNGAHGSRYSPSDAVIDTRPTPEDEAHARDVAAKREARLAAEKARRERSEKK